MAFPLDISDSYGWISAEPSLIPQVFGLDQSSEVNTHLQPFLTFKSQSKTEGSLASFAVCASNVVSFFSGALLLGGGVYTLLDRLFPVTMAM